MRGRPAEVDLCRRRTAKRLMRAEVGVVDEAHLDLLHQILRHHGPQQVQAERVLQRPPQTLDQRDRALLPDRPEPLLRPEAPERPAKHLCSETARLIRDEVIRRPVLLPRPRNEAGYLFGRGLKWIKVGALAARARTNPRVWGRQWARHFPCRPT